ncbi:hypothetical protein D3C75_772140 [compost metagenome]
MPFGEILQRPGHDGVGMNQLGSPVLFHLLSFITQGKNNMVGKNAASLCITGYSFWSKFKVTGFSMFIYADTI